MSLDSLVPPVALVLSGGGAQGAAQAGAIVELVEAGLRVDLVIGTSVGAWNGAWVARDLDPTHVHRMLAWWLDPEVRSLFKGLRRGVLAALARRDSSALGDSRVRRLLQRTCGSWRLESLALPLAVSAIDLLTGELVYLDRGDLCDAVRAASAIPAVFPPVALDGRLLVDAGFVDNFGVGEAIARGARSIVLIDASVGGIGDPPTTIRSVLDRANLVTRMHQRTAAGALAAEAGVALEIVEVAITGSVLDFAAAARQIAHGRAAARARLEGTSVAGGTAALHQPGHAACTGTPHKLALASPGLPG